ncbi:Glycosyltransferase, catalytic subunit of cellulose synthase and poly-beta-1,6-N-acetylglucosamine synthase [Desulfonatronum thiosulfatophilum]|uniref:Glycosyltransferase, catalytic subunit of cellulose synthase and poly-beta-1,6-N-acetylglucosamine synthase n=1 Tax=Desulfonatronum thiosulfatophilum TaxID=617002 RepID=A0A1G6EKK3_9BACT|nr:glycosyltransferase family 2 protein [Desulfonatronum thiosulfatophilum]SDB58033.1 Glycosyltransferase, catalytic subunit of cellulose synthase and poly-beta-1,6-N-acetylglucosamine synthase [Desulfonatronum thiosulfatophilum]
MIEIFFWVCFLLLFYAFIGYPALIWIFARTAGQRSRFDERRIPTVSMLLSVYNEEQVIRSKLENFLQLDYDSQALEMIVVSDGCSDGTEAIVASFDSPRIRLIVQEERGGKTLALNRAAAEAKGDILVFTDANSMFAPDALRKLTRHFADPEVGLVSGRSVYLDARNNTEHSGGVYRQYEDFIKEQESGTVSIVGADGAIYALRADLYQPLPAEYINDFIHPLQVVCRGLRAVQESEALCREVQDGDAGKELQRQTRIMAQSWLIVFSQAKNLLHAGRVGHFWAMISHKVLRWITLPLMAALLFFNLLLLDEGLRYQILFTIQFGFYLAVIAGWRRTEGLLRVPAMFTLLHAAAVLGLCRLMTGQVFITWDPRKQ